MRAILTYHSIDTSGSVISVDPATFAAHVRWLASGRVAVVPLDALIAMPEDSAAIAITFDDAFTNFAAHAWPRLRDAGLPATLFVPTRFVGATNAWDALPGGGMPSLPILDWPALAHLQEDGVTLGAHSRTHADFRTLSAAALHDEVEGSFEDLRRETGRRPDSFAYPYGYWTAAAREAARAACRCAVTTVLGAIEGPVDAHLLPRLDAYYLSGPARLERFGSWSFDRFIRLRAVARRVGRTCREALAG